MSTTPIKRKKSLVLLSREHHDGLLVVWKIRQGLRFLTQNERMADFVVNEFNVHLAPHFLKEEELLFAKLDATDELRIKAESEHTLIRNAVTAMQPTYIATNSLIEKFATLLEDHIRFEERILFPHIEKTVAEDELEKIGLELEKKHHKGKTPKWKDEFWTRK